MCAIFLPALGVESACSASFSVCDLLFSASPPILAEFFSVMFHRLAAVFIVLFWLAMTTLLMERHFFPESSRLSQVPVYHIAQVFFQNEQASDLMAYKGRETVGFARISPRSDRRNRTNSVDIS